jgi:uncharacterized protein (TIGR02145 family)
MKKYLVSSFCFLAIVNFVLLSCSEDGSYEANVVVKPTIITTPILLINQTAATGGGNLTSTGGGTILSRGVCYSTEPNPTTADNKKSNPGTLGTFETILTGLTASTQYYARAYASNSKGTSYGAQVTFTTTAIAVASPVVTTTPITDITETTASSGGNVTSAGGSAIIARGVCWSLAPNPTTVDNVLSATGTTGVFTSLLTNLTANTTYYLRAFATNSGGIGYGAEVTFTTNGAVNIDIPEVITTDASAITQTTASSGGNVLSEGGAPVTARGICWSTGTSPTTADNVINATGTTGVFTSSITGLLAETTYYVRAFASNIGGTAYGDQITFTTTAGSTTGPSGGSAVCDGSQPTVVVTITSSTGKIWMDRNLGASRAATSAKDYEAYGCLYQWGRGNDGHASITWSLGEEGPFGEIPGEAVNGTTAILSTTDSPGNAFFITDEVSIPYDWRSPKNNNLWQGVSGINNPCPTGFRIPTKAEFQAEITAYSITGPTGAYNTIHKFPLAGSRAFDSGMIRAQGEEIWFWTSTTDNNDSYNVLIQVGAVYTNVSNGRAGGYSVRCIKN